MEKQPSAALLDHFTTLPDPRIARHRWHKLSDIVVIAVCAVLGGAESFPASEDLGGEREAWLSQFLEWPEGIPSHDTFKRGLRLLAPGQFQACCVSWRPAVAAVTAGEVGAMDGKARRRAFAKGPAKRAIHMVSAGATAHGVVLGQRKGDAKSHASPAIPELLALRALQGGIVTRDARGCQRASAQKIVEQGADYGLALKGNQPTLEQVVEGFFVTGPEAEAHRTARAYAEQTERGQGRGETRCAWISAELNAELTARAWPGLRSIGMVAAPRTLAGETPVEQRFYLTSLQPAAQHFARAVRNHWGLENKLPGTLDVTFREDQSRLRTGHGPENFALLRHIALNLLRQEPTPKSLPRKRLTCALNPDYLLKVLLGQ